MQNGALNTHCFLLLAYFLLFLRYATRSFSYPFAAASPFRSVDIPIKKPGTRPPDAPPYQNTNPPVPLAPSASRIVFTTVIGGIQIRPCS